MKTKAPTQVKERKVRFYQKAIFPWAIIFTFTVFFGGVVVGWTLFAGHKSAVTAEAMSIVSLSEQK